MEMPEPCDSQMFDEPLFDEAFELRACGMNCGRTTDIGQICEQCAKENKEAGRGYFDNDPKNEQREAELRGY